MPTSSTQIVVSILLVVTALVVLAWDTIQLNTIVFLTLSRGIISQNCFWWSVTDMFQDVTGTELYTKLKTRRFVPLPIFGKEIVLLTQIQDIQQLLEGSPNPFGPGLFKQQFFDSFIPTNVGISINPEWKYRREYNDKVLETDAFHHLTPVFRDVLKEAYNMMMPRTFTEAKEFTRRVTSKLIFGTYSYNPVIYKVFQQADSFWSARFNIHSVDSVTLHEFRTYLQEQVQHPAPNTLLSVANMYHSMLPLDVIVDQIPHWIFPIAGLFSVHLPRLYVLLSNHPKDLEFVSLEIQADQHMGRESYTRKCILELFRLNNAVNSTFRSILEPYQFNNADQIFPAGTQFVFFNNPLLRDLFERSNEYIPSRWSPREEQSIRALMFNQGHQRCPGKELVLTLMSLGLAEYLKQNNYKLETSVEINPSFVPYLINPCTITIESDDSSSSSDE